MAMPMVRAGSVGSLMTPLRKPPEPFEGRSIHGCGGVCSRAGRSSRPTDVADRHGPLSHDQTLQYRLMSGGSSANNRIIGIDPSRERLQFWVPAGQTSLAPGLSNSNGSTLVSGGGQSLEFLGLPDLSLTNLTILSATAVL